MAKVTGIVKVFVNGTLQRSKEGAKLITGGKERVAQTGYAVYGYAEKVVPAQLEFTLARTADADLEALNDMTDATLRFEEDIGVTWLITNAFTTKPVEITGGEGDVAVEMQGDPAVKE
jgi:hypothetical protein